MARFYTYDGGKTFIKKGYKQFHSMCAQYTKLEWRSEWRDDIDHETYVFYSYATPALIARKMTQHYQHGTPAFEWSISFNYQCRLSPSTVRQINRFMHEIGCSARTKDMLRAYNAGAHIMIFPCFIIEARTESSLLNEIKYYDCEVN